MTRPDINNSSDRIATALAQARRHKHHTDCHCRRYEGYCTPGHALWCRAVDRELDALVGNK